MDQNLDHYQIYLLIIHIIRIELSVNLMIMQSLDLNQYVKNVMDHQYHLLNHYHMIHHHLIHNFFSHDFYVYYDYLEIHLIFTSNYFLIFNLIIISYHTYLLLFIILFSFLPTITYLNGIQPYLSNYLNSYPIKMLLHDQINLIAYLKFSQELFIITNFLLLKYINELLVMIFLSYLNVYHYLIVFFLFYNILQILLMLI